MAGARRPARRGPPHPLAELERLLGLWRAYELAGAADELMAAERADEAGALYRRAPSWRPSPDELLFWAGLAIAHTGDLDEGVAAVRRAAEVQPNWLVLLDRLSPDFAAGGRGRPRCAPPRLAARQRAVERDHAVPAQPHPRAQP